jgi:hypothetical protein
MNRTLRRTVVVAVVGAGVIAVRRMTARQFGNGADETRDRWHAVTINRPPEEVKPDGHLPEPLAELGDAVEVRLRPAPGGRGTEVAARLRGDVPSGLAAAARIAGNDPRQDLRAALRQSRQLLETGEVLRADEPPTTRRTLRGLPLDLATRRAGGEGRL